MWLLPWPRLLKTIIFSCKDKHSLAKIHALFISTGFLTHGNSNALLLKAYARIDDAAIARKLFDNLPRRGVDVFNAMIVAYSRQNSPEQAVRLYQWMVSEGVTPDSSSFTVALKACASLMDLRMGEEIWLYAIECGYECDAFVGSSVLNLYSKCGNVDEALKVFDRLPRRDIVCWTSMINMLVKNGRSLEAFEIFRRMENERVKADGVVMLGLLQGSASLGDLKLGLSVHGNLIRRGLDVGVVVLTGLVDMYAKMGKLEFAFRVFRKMTCKSGVSWGALISGFVQHGFVGDALEMLVEMQSCGFEPDLACLVSAVLACSQVGLLRLGRSIHGYVARRLGFDEIWVTAVVEMYSKCGSLSCARSLFNMASTKDLILWNVMISCYAIHGHGKEALLIFLEMMEIGLKPDQTTFASLLSACSHSGLVEEGRYWFSRMHSEYKIQPGDKHYLCMVDLLSRAGNVEEAYELISSMNTEPSLPNWVTLLAGCYNHRKLSIGEIAAKRILELDPHNLGIYALLSNFYAREQKWSEVADLRNTMKQKGNKKIPGYSAVELNGKFHSFLIEDNSHRHYEDIVQFLRRLDNEMRIVGCAQDVELVLHNLEVC